MVTSSFVGHILEFIHHFTSLTATEEDLNPVIETAVRYLPMADASVLECLLTNKHPTSEECMKGAFHTVFSGTKETSLSRAVEIVVQMLLTRIAAFRMILLATPEAIFARR